MKKPRSESLIVRSPSPRQSISSGRPAAADPQKRGSDVLANVAATMAQSATPEEGVAAIFNQIQKHLGDAKATLYRSDGEQLLPSAGDIEHAVARELESVAAVSDDRSYALSSKGRIEGVLLLDRPAEPQANNEVLAALLDMAALALRCARLEQENERATTSNVELLDQAELRARVFHALHQITVAASSGPEPRALARLVVDQTRDILKVDSASLFWWEPDQDLLVPLANNDELRAGPELPLQASAGAPGLALQRGGPVIVENYQAWPNAVEWGLAQGLVTAAAVPLLVNDRALGALSVRTYSPRHYEPEQILLLSLFAAQVGPALEAARLHAESEERQAKLAADFTRARELSLELAASEERLRTVYQAIACGVMVHNAEGELVHANRAAEQILGMSFSEMRQARASELFENISWENESGQVEREQPYMKVLRMSLSVRSCTAKISRADGTTRWLQVDCTPVFGAGEGSTQVVSSFIDLTERKQAEEALSERETRFRSIFESAAIGVCRSDLQGRLVETNRAMQEMLGYSAEELTGKPFVELTDPADVPTNLAYHRELVSGTRDHYRIEKRYYRKSGEPVWVNVTTSLVRGPSREPLFCMAIVEDITSRRRAEVQLQTLAQSAKLRALGQMASGVAHDLNQYLGLVAGHGELALRALDKKAPDIRALRDSLGTMIQAALDCAETVKRLQAFARPRQEGAPERFDVGELLREVERLTAPRWRDAAQEQGRPISLHVEVNGDASIEGWPASLREACTNLVFNSVDALPNGGTIRLSAKRIDNRVDVEVVDSGVGMTTEVQARIFEPFFSTKGNRGTGLGLAMVFGIVERHQGQIALESQPGQGTVFRLSFPASQAEPAPPTAANVAHPARALHILAVDDEPALAKLLSVMLTSDGHRVEVATSGEEAIELLATRSFDLVISDVGMGAGMNGWDLAERVRSEYPDLRFCLATGWGAMIDPEEARGRGVQAVVAKPYRLSDLRNILFD